MEALKLHAGIYFSGSDNVALDELRAKELVSKITEAAGSGSYTEEMAAMVAELNALKKRIAEQKSKQKEASRISHRMEEISEAIDGLKAADIRFDDGIARKLIECIRVQSAEAITITYRGGMTNTVPLDTESMKSVYV